MKYFLCRECDKKYEERDRMLTSRKLEDYLKAHLGFCSEKCYNKLSEMEKFREKMILHVHGTVRKDNHYKL